MKKGVSIFQQPILKGTRFILAIFLCAGLFGCQKKPSIPNQERVINVSFQEGDLPSLHPHDLVIYLRGLSLAKTLYEGLTRVNAQGGVDLTGAASYQVSDDFRCYTFKLRPNRWSDGSLVTAHHYEQAWKKVLDPRGDCSRADLLYLVKNAQKAKKGELSLDEVGVRALDAHTLFVELEYPSPCFLQLLTQPVCFPLKEPEKKEMVAFNGPFVVESWEKGNHLLLKPNPYFWNTASLELDRIAVTFIEDSMTAFSLFERGELDWVGVPLTPLSGELVDYLDHHQLLVRSPVDRAFWYYLNVQHPLLKNEKIRQALSLATNRKGIVNHILKSGAPLNKAFPQSVLPVQLKYALQEDGALARTKFAEGLAELELTEQTAPPLVITYSQQANRKQVAEYLQQIWSAALPLKVELQSKEWTVLRTDLERGNFEASGCFEVSYYQDPLELMERFTADNPANFPKWSDPAYIALIAAAREEADPQKRLELLGQAEEILVQKVPFIPISSDEFLFAHHPNLRGYVFDYVGAIDLSRANMNAR